MTYEEFLRKFVEVARQTKTENPGGIWFQSGRIRYYQRYTPEFNSVRNAECPICFVANRSNSPEKFRNSRAWEAGEFLGLDETSIKRIINAADFESYKRFRRGLLAVVRGVSNGLS